MSTYPRLIGLFAATNTALVPDGSLNLGAIEHQAAHLIDAGISGVFITGTTGECLSLSVDERIAITGRWAEVRRGTPLRMIVHVGHNCQADARVLAEAAVKNGADAVAALAPSYFKPASVGDLVRFMVPVAKAAEPLPFYYYDIPMLTGVSLSTAEFLDHAANEIGNLAGVKFTNMDLVGLQECLACGKGRFDILYGIDEVLLAALALGVQGAVGSSYNFAAPLYLRIIQAFQRGDMQTARDEQVNAIRLIRLLSRFGYLSAAKYMMALAGVDCGPVRPPLKLLTDDDKCALRHELEKSGLLAALRCR